MGLKDETAAAYSSAADHFDDPVLSFWDRFGRRTVERLDLRPGERVLDACCGTGASALPAAHAVGPAPGYVLGLDLAEPALARARDKAAAQGLSNVDFRVSDIEHTGLPSGTFDAVVCVFGIFFLPDMAAGMAELWRLIRPGGRLAVTVWGPRWIEPGSGFFWDAVGRERPDLVRAFAPWERITTPEALGELFEAGGTAPPELVAEAGTHPLPRPEDWWTVVLGTGLRATVDKLGPEPAGRVRQANLAWAMSQNLAEIEASVVLGVATRPVI